MKAILLGTAAGGGLPQWNCACPLCGAARSGRIPHRTQDCVAVSGDERFWWLLNASPDIRAQLLATRELAPGPGPRDTPLCGVLLTDAELDHILGLAVLRGAAGLSVHAPGAVLDALGADFPLRSMLDTYAPWTWCQTEPGIPVELRGGLRATALPVGGKAPKYVRSADRTREWAVAYRIEDPATGGVLLYAPNVGAWSDALEVEASEAHCVLVDGTFWSADEMADATGGSAGQAAMGHMPVTGSAGSLRHLGGTAARRIYIHLNNTNPAGDPWSDECTQLARAGVEVLPDGHRLTIRSRTASMVSAEGRKRETARPDGPPSGTSYTE